MTTESCLAANRAQLEKLLLADPWVDELGAEIVEWDGGRATFRLTPVVRHCNFVGTVHGGVLFALADAALGVACNSWGRVCLALTIESQFLSAAQAGETLVATAAERSRTRRTAAYAIDVVSETDGVLRAGFSAMAFRTGRWHLGEDAWSEDWRSTH